MPPYGPSPSILKTRRVEACNTSGFFATTSGGTKYPKYERQTYKNSLHQFPHPVRLILLYVFKVTFGSLFADTLKNVDLFIIVLRISHCIESEVISLLFR